MSFSESNAARVIQRRVYFHQPEGIGIYFLFWRKRCAINASQSGRKAHPPRSRISQFHGDSPKRWPMQLLIVWSDMIEGSVHGSMGDVHCHLEGQ